MAVEPVTDKTTPDGLVETDPPPGDPFSEGDDHLRLIKVVMQNFYNDFTDERSTRKVVIPLELETVTFSLGAASGHEGEYYFMTPSDVTTYLTGTEVAALAGSINTKGVVWAQPETENNGATQLAEWILIVNEEDAQEYILTLNTPDDPAEGTPLFRDGTDFISMRQIAKDAQTFTGGNWFVESLGGGSSMMVMQNDGANVRAGTTGTLSKDSGGSAFALLLTAGDATLIFFKNTDTFLNQFPADLVTSQNYAYLNFQDTKRLFAFDFRITR